MPGIRAAFLVLRALETGKHVLEGPPGVSELAPVVVVPRLPAHVEQPVDGARSAQHLAPGPVQHAPVELRFRLGGIAPVRGRIVHRLEVADRNVDPGVAVLAPRFQQQHAGGRIGGQAVRHHAAGRSGADDNEIVVPRLHRGTLSAIRKRDRGHACRGGGFRSTSQRRLRQDFDRSLRVPRVLCLPVGVGLQARRADRECPGAEDGRSS